MKKEKPQTMLSNWYLFQIMWETDKGYVLLAFLQQLLSFATWCFYSVVFMKYLFGAAEVRRTFGEIATFVLISSGVMLVLGLFLAWYSEYYLRKTEQRLYRVLNAKMFAKVLNADVECYEDSEFFNNYTVAASEIHSRGPSVVNNLATLFSSSLSTAFVAYTMFSVNVFTGFFALIPVIGNLTLGRLAHKYMYQRDMESVPFKRRQEYVNRVFYLQKYAKEIRLTKVFKIMQKTYDKAFEGIVAVSEKYWKRVYFTEEIKNIVCFPLAFQGLWLFGAFCAMVQKSIQIGDFVILASAIVSVTWMLVSFTGSVNESYSNGLYAQKLRAFLEYEPRIPENSPGLPVPAEIETLALQNVSFTYKGQQTPALENISMTLTAGQCCALVGHNGSGKSTLIKLLLRLYDPTEGEILLNGRNIKEYELSSYRALFGTTFQDFQLFSLSLLENMAAGADVTPALRQKAEQALAFCGLAEKVCSLKQGIDTVLTREFDDDGAVFSGGETQKAALARCFVQEKPIMLLDEPSSALDPSAEDAMYENIYALCKGEKGAGKISLVISHRLSGAAMADRILLFGGGKLLEFGAHGDLMAHNGAYADMFRMQAESYMFEVTA